MRHRLARKAAVEIDQRRARPPHGQQERAALDESNGKIGSQGLRLVETAQRFLDLSLLLQGNAPGNQGDDLLGERRHQLR